MKNKHVSYEEFVYDATSPLPKRSPEEIAKLILSDDINGYDKKLILNTVNELFETAKLLQEIRTVPKITVFGSARTEKEHPDYQLCKEFSAQAANLGYMIITGAGPGIMEAAPEGAGPENSIGVGIELPFEKGVCEPLKESKYLITYKYFFCRKLTFIREADAVVLFPGGFGTMDEAFETLTLLHTGRSMPVPFVLMEEEGGTYWEDWMQFVKRTLLKDSKNISPNDLYLFRRFSDPTEAVDYINNFYRRYHSMRYVDDSVIIRLNSPLPKSLLEELKEEYADFLGDFGIQETEPLSDPDVEPDLAHLPRIMLKPNLTRPVDLYCLVRSLNREVTASSTRRQDRDEISPPPRPTRVRKK